MGYNTDILVNRYIAKKKGVVSFKRAGFVHSSAVVPGMCHCQNLNKVHSYNLKLRPGFKRMIAKLLQ